MIEKGTDRQRQAAEHIATVMCGAARTAPKARGIDNLVTLVVTGDDLARLAAEMRRIAKESGVAFFERDAGNVEASVAVVLFGQRPVPSNVPNCGYCGYRDCEENVREGRGVCAISASDLGIAIASAVSVAADHRIDNRIMFSTGRAALSLGWFEDEKVTIAYGVPLSVSGKNPYFDRK